MSDETRVTLNIAGAFLLLTALVLGGVLYENCVHPQEMAKLGYVQVEGGRYVPAKINDPRVDELEQNYVGLVTQLKDVVSKLQRQIIELKETKKDK